MKKLKRLTAFILATALFFASSVPAGNTDAASFDSLDANTAVAGASASLRNYFETNPDAAAMLAEVLHPISTISEDPELVAGTEVGANEDVMYEEEVIGVANVESFLNVRSSATALSEVIGGAVRGEDLAIVGERLVNGKKWYIVNRSGVMGYVASAYVLFGEEAEAFRKLVEEEKRDPMEIPATFELTDDISGLDEETQEKIRHAIAEVRYVLQNDYAPAAEKAAEGNNLDLYFVLLYLLELAQTAQDLTEEYNLTSTFKEAGFIARAAELNREHITEVTGNDEQDFYTILSDKKEEARKAKEEAEAAARRAQEAKDEQERIRLQQEAEAAQRRAQEAEEAARKQEQQNQEQAQQGAGEGSDNPIGRQIADFAASWVGRIHYGWGCDAFYEGGYVDCSHFTYHVFLQFGLIGGYTTSGGQRSWGRAVSLDQIQPGDLVCYNGHVAIYYGNGMIVHAPVAGRDIEYGSLYVLPVVAVRRLY